ncbi:MAG TPA: hypothetical protein VL361_09960 [Candidatus Limnocylindrales bacterium]|jgi:DNA-directed RNA polymerase subunit RPC12/RpoP|nr:hypothetical protein [Candidatus Limnocylindrales bacterium]
MEEFSPVLAILGLVVGITWLIFPFVVMGRLRDMLAVLKDNAQELGHIRRLMGEIRVPTELLPKPPPPPLQHQQQQQESQPTSPAKKAYCDQCGQFFEFYPEQWQTAWVPCSRCGKSVDSSLHQERVKPGPDPPVLWSCRCQLCSKEIEFAPEQEGATVACPHCGMETQLYRTSR